MEKQYSSGGIVVNNKGEILLVRNYKKDRDVDYWGFPKGHIEKGESEQDAAIREVYEETGIVVNINKKIKNIKYNAGKNKNGEKIIKKVSFFLMSYISGSIKPKSNELSDVAWLPSKEGLKRLTFENDKELLKTALSII